MGPIYVLIGSPRRPMLVGEHKDRVSPKSIVIATSDRDSRTRARQHSPARLPRDGRTSVHQDSEGVVFARKYLRGEVSTGDDAVDQARILKPHVVLMDLSMPGSIARQLRRLGETVFEIGKIVTGSGRVIEA